MLGCIGLYSDYFLMRLWLVLLVVATVLASKGNRPVSTIIAGLWDIKRGELKGGYARSFEYYLDHFKVLLQTEANLIIFGTKELKLFVEKHRKRPNYVFIVKELEWFEGMWHNPLIERVRKHYKETRPDWYVMKNLPEFALYLYNTVVMTKLFLMRQALDYDLWNSDFFLWQDGGINHSFFDGSRNEVIVAPSNMGEAYAHLFPWHLNFRFFIRLKFGDSFELSKHAAFANYFNLYSEAVTDFAGAYENYLRICLEEYEMTTDQGVFSKMYYRLPFLMPVINGLAEGALNHHFEVNSYYQQRARTVRRFAFGKEFERVVEEMQQEKQLWTPIKQKAGNTTLQASNQALQVSECRRLQTEWLLIHDLSYKKSRALKHAGLFCLMLFLLLKVKKPENHSILLPQEQQFNDPI